MLRVSLLIRQSSKTLFEYDTNLESDQIGNRTLNETKKRRLL